MRFLALAAVAAAFITAIFSNVGSLAAKEEPDPPATGGIVVHMDEQNGSGIDGRAEIFPADGGAKTVVQVFINGLAPGSSHAAMIHIGCTGGIDVNLGNVVAQAGVTTGRSVTTIDRPFSAIADGTHVVDVHGDDGKVISCGQIPAQPVAPRPDVLPPAGARQDAGNAGAALASVLLVAGLAVAGSGALMRRTRLDEE